MSDQPFWKLQLIIISVAVVGAFAKYSNEILSGKEFSIERLVATFFLSVFSGYLFGTFALGMELSPQYAIIFTGVGSFMGQQSIDFLFTKFTK